MLAITHPMTVCVCVCVCVHVPEIDKKQKDDNFKMKAFFVVVL